jgi:uroporphyrin-III C-methyltransferase/precorrin-2 dehydrogenase/sirohydrochlorin ferrochelatase
MDYLPIFLRLTDEPALVVGGGTVAARKVSLLRQANARVTVVSPTLDDALKQLKASNEIVHINGPYQDDMIKQYRLVIAATDDAGVNQKIFEQAKAFNIPVNVVDQPALCSFIMPSIVDRSPVVLAISTGGSSPVLARMIRSRLEALIPASYGHLATLAQKYRPAIKAKFQNVEHRRKFWESALEGKVSELVLSGRDNEAERILQAAINKSDETTLEEKGEVYLVGAGPGDPDLLTFRALRLMQRADVVLYDRLVSDEIVAMVRRDAEKIYVGKEKSNHAVPQRDINKLLVKLALEGKRVLRLKGGDPFIFGRGGEEIKDLFHEGIPFQVVPGVTAAAGCAAYAGIPLTHREFSQSVSFVTGHLKDGSFNLNWSLLSQPQQTVVIYMGLTGLEIISRKLIEHGVSHDMPAALVQQGTTRNQRVITATLSTLHDKVKAEHVVAPTLVIIGEVVTLQDQLKWFDPSESSGIAIGNALG